MAASLDRPLRYRQIDASGPPREMGQQIGEAAREEIRGFSGIALERVNKTIRVSRQRALDVAEKCIGPAEAYAPAMVEELRGMAESSGVTLVDLMLLQIRNQLQGEDCGCTSLAWSGLAWSDARSGEQNGKQSLVAQNWDNDPGLDPFTVVLIRRPQGKPACMTITQAGLIGYIGFNEAGIGLCLNTLPAPSRLLGVPHYFTVRGILESRSLEEAVHAVRRAERAIPANIMLSTPQGPTDLEVTIDDVHVLRDSAATSARGALVTHTNHGLHAALHSANERFPDLIESRPRKARVDFLLGTGPRRTATADTATDSPAIYHAQPATHASGPVPVFVQTALSDHDNFPRSICRHASDDPKTGFWETVFSVIIEPTAHRMHVSRGQPCCKPYETYVLA